MKNYDEDRLNSSNTTPLDEGEDLFLDQLDSLLLSADEMEWSELYPEDYELFINSIKKLKSLQKRLTSRKDNG